MVMECIGHIIERKAVRYIDMEHRYDVRPRREVTCPFADAVIVC